MVDQSVKPTEAEQSFHDEVKRIVGEACGAVSLCWEPRPEGVFDSVSAAAFVAEAVNQIMVLPSKGMTIPEYQHVHRWSAPKTNGSAKPTRRTGQRRCLDCHAWEGEG